MTTEELLIPRYEVIADYPNNTFGKIGDIITPQSFESEDDFYDWELGKYPHLFRSLHWAEKRELNELPKYVKMNRRGTFFIYKVDEWKKDWSIATPICKSDSDTKNKNNFMSVCWFFYKKGSNPST